jgi:FdhD protein
MLRAASVVTSNGALVSSVAMTAPIIAREGSSEPTAPAEVRRIVPGTPTVTARRDTLAVEEPLEIHLNGWRWLVTMRTPGADADLVLGMLASEGVIADAAEVASLVFRRHPEEPDLANVVDVRLDRATDDLAARLARNSALASTSCGLCGASSVEAVLRERPPLAAGPTVAAHVIAALPARLAAAQPVFAATGGLHGAALCAADGTLLASREDVGRHNAVDKVIGWRLRTDPRPRTPILLVSGRASFEIVQKAHAAAIPIVASVSAPSSLAVRLAEDAGMTLAGFVRDGGFNLYSGRARIAETDTAPAADGLVPSSDRDPSAPGADPLAFMSRDLRAALDDIQRKISLGDWRALTRSERTRLETLATHASHEDFAAYLIDRVTARTGNAPRMLGASPPAS